MRRASCGCRAEHGCLRISGRTNELIIRGGENIYPAELIEVDAIPRTGSGKILRHQLQQRPANESSVVPGASAS
ncbi:hypothetical protein [Pseudonocardia acidicola]|uniref:hypothetical protein n=1 Tax=Pseudonocardia acidicola TaxID=2724939 RepID=UPI001B7CFE62|nr:hypothetical protein [Pseudonocardia acidicola]